MNEKKYIIWDMDGTLLNTIEDLAASTNYALEKNSLPLRTLEEVTQFVGNGLGVLAEKAVPDGKNNPLYEKVLSDLKEHYSQHWLVKTKPYDGLDKVLDSLSSSGYKMAIVSNKPDQQLEELRKRFFDRNIKISIGDQEGQRRKPYPDGVYKAMEKLGAVKENTVYIGDSEVDLATARNAGLDCISVSWGFRPRALLEEKGADTIISNPEELLLIL